MPEIRGRYTFFHEVEPALAQQGFTDFRYYRMDDPRYPYKSHSLYGVDASGSTGVVCTVMGNGQFLTDWIEFYSPLLDGRTLRSNNHPLAGALRPVPSAIIGRMPGERPRGLLEFHSAEFARMQSLGSRFVERMTVDQAVQADRDYYRDQIAHWIATGLLVPDR